MSLYMCICIIAFTDMYLLHTYAYTYVCVRLHMCRGDARSISAMRSGGRFGGGVHGCNVRVCVCVRVMQGLFANFVSVS